MNKYILFLAAVVIAIGRVFIVPRLTHIPSIEGGYEAMAHLIVGFLIIVPFYDRDEKLGPSHSYGILGWALALWELGWFMAQKYLGLALIGFAVGIAPMAVCKATVGGDAKIAHRP